ncbi:NUDIX hydrolase [Ensifer soli]|uniref:NUDIX hydrolase n=1 Tax=Ciceribacter sp. sgz301302 TaxID=3342379 RepID=UPI0035BA23D4
MPPKAQPASSAILERDGRFLLVRRGRAPSAGMYAFPGGRGEAGETPAETALRELSEETGIVGRNPVLFRVYDLAPPETAARYFVLSVFTVEADPGAVAVAADDADAVGWFTPDEIRRLPAPDSVRDCIAAITGTRP